MLVRRWPWGLAFLAAALVLGGCGSAPPPRSAAKEIGEAERMLTSAGRAEKEGNFDLAISTCNQALEPIRKGKTYAVGPEQTRLSNLERDVRDKLNDLEIKKVTQTRTADPSKGSSGPAPDVVDPVELQRREAAKKQADEKERLRKLDEQEKALMQVAKTSPKPEDSEDTGTASAQPGGNPAAAAPSAPKKPAGLFPEVYEKSPPVDVVKMVKRGRYAIAYVQLYINREQGRAVMKLMAYFKDKDNQTICKSELGYLYKGFRADNANPVNQGTSATAITMGSLSITGFESAQIVMPVESNRADEIKKVNVTVAYGDGEETGEGPHVLEEGGGGAAPAPAKAK